MLHTGAGFGLVLRLWVGLLPSCAKPFAKFATKLHEVDGCAPGSRPILANGSRTRLYTSLCCRAVCTRWLRARLEARPGRALAADGTVQDAGLSPAGGAASSSAAALQDGGQAAGAETGAGYELYETVEFSLRVPSGLDQVFAPPPNRANLGERTLL